MTVGPKDGECHITLDGQQFVTQRLESQALLQDLRQLRRKTVLLQLQADTPYRCIGSAIITLQQARVKFRAPQIPSD